MADAAGGLIPGGEVVVLRLVGVDRSRVRDAADGGEGWLFTLRFAVAGGRWDGAPVRRLCWSTLGGAQDTVRQMRAFGVAHPVELVGTPGREYRVRAGVAVEEDRRTGEVFNTARWFDPAPPARAAPPPAGDPVDTAAAF
jgi:hypothetical protein